MLPSCSSAQWSLLSTGKAGTRSIRKGDRNQFQIQARGHDDEDDHNADRPPKNRVDTVRKTIDTPLPGWSHSPSKCSSRSVPDMLSACLIEYRRSEHEAKVGLTGPPFWLPKPCDPYTNHVQHQHRRGKDGHIPRV